MSAFTGHFHPDYSLIMPPSSAPIAIHRLTDYQVSISPYVRAQDLKRDLDEQFREKFPKVKISLSKIRQYKRDMINIIFSEWVSECQLYFYFPIDYWLESIISMY